MQQNPCLILKSLIFGPRSEAYWSPCSIPSVKKSYLAYTCHGSGQKKRPIEGKIPCPSIAIRSCWCSWWWLRMVWRVINLQIRICTIGCWFYTACRKVSGTCLKALECINYQSLSSSRFHDISESPSVPWRFHGHRVVLCRFPAKKEKGDIELLQHIACLDVRPQTRTAKKKIPTEATSQDIENINPSILEVLKHVSFKPFPSSFHESMNQNSDLVSRSHLQCAQVLTGSRLRHGFLFRQPRPQDLTEILGAI